MSDDESEELASLKNGFDLVLCADYQMCKLVPYWGHSAQPGCTYYLQKLSHDIFGIVNHGTNCSTVYLFDERAGPKNTDHTVSYITDYISKLPEWITRLHIFLDNASSTNKNFYTMAWALEMIQQKRVKLIRISFLVGGHTKFSPDLLFSKISQSYNRSDVFSTEELRGIISTYAEVVLDDGHLVCDWKNPLTKYSKLPGIRNLHDFVFVQNPVSNSDCESTRYLLYWRI